MHELTLSLLPHTWLLDLDGTLLVHNGYKNETGEMLLEGSLKLMQSIPANDTIILLTSRKKDMAQETESFLKENGIRFDHIIYDLPYGERILINDIKPSGLKTCFGINVERDRGIKINLNFDNSL